MEEEDALERQLRAVNERLRDIEQQNDRGRETVVILIGSHSTSYGFADWPFPQKIRTCISQRTQTPFDAVPQCVPPRLDNLDALRRKLIASGTLRERAKSARGEEIRLVLDRAAQLGSEALGDVVVGAALKIDGYNVRFPLCEGALNPRAEPNYSEERALNDLCAIIEHVLLRCLSAEASERDLILGIPEQFGRSTIERLCELVMNRIRPRALLFHNESALAFFGRNCPLGALVDLGHTKSTFACVEEGVLQRETLFQSAFCARKAREFWREILRARRGVELAPYDFGCLEERIWESCARWSLNAAHCPSPLAYRVELESVSEGKRVEIVIHSEDFVLALNAFFEQSDFALDKAFIEWLERQTAESVRSKIAANVVFSGGLCAIPGFAPIFEQRVAARAKALGVGEVTAATENRELAGGEPAFLGATALPKLECFSDIVVFREQFVNLKEESQKSGIEDNYLKEKLLFNV